MQSRLKRYGALIAAILLYTVGVATTFYLTTNWTARQTGAVILTGVVLVWYTWETALLRLATFSQREVQLRPFVIIEPRPGGFWARNVGVGPALNVSIAEVVVDRTADVTIKFRGPICLLEPGQSVEVPASSFKNGRDAGDFFLPHIDPEYANRDLRLSVSFQNADMRHYTVTESVRPGVLSILELSAKDATSD